MTQFGAVGDGVTDDTAAIQAAIDAAAAVKGCVYLPASTTPYLLGSTVVIGDDVNGLQLRGYGATIKMADGTVCDNTGIPLYIYGADNVVVEGLTIDANGQNRTWQSAYCHGVFMINSRDITLRDVSSLNGMQDCFSIQYGAVGDSDTYCKRIKMINCEGLRGYRQGLSIVAAWDVHIIGGRFADTFGTSPEAGIDIEADPSAGEPCNRGIIIDGVTFENNNGNNLQLSGQYGSPSDTRVTNCVFRMDDYKPEFTADTGNDRLDIVGHQFVVGNPVVVQTTNTLPSPLSILTAYYVVAISDDWIQISTTRGGAAVDITTTGSGTHNIHRASGQLTCQHPAIIMGNKFEHIYPGRGCVDVGPVSQAGKTIIANNRFEDIGYGRKQVLSGCIYIHGSSSGNVIVSGNYAENVNTFVMCNADNCVVQGNIVNTMTNTYGCFFQGGGNSDGVSITGNVISGANINAIFLASGDRAVITGNQIRDTVVWGNRAYGTIRAVSGAHATITGNHITLATPDTAAVPIYTAAWGTTHACNMITGYGTDTVSTVTTTDGTVTTLATVLTTADRVYQVTADVIATETVDHDEMASYRIIGTFRNDGGVLAQVGATTVVASAEDTAGWDCVFDTSSTSIRIRVTGASATNVNWKSQLSWQEIP